jgi:hypothetical protein
LPHDGAWRNEPIFQNFEQYVFNIFLCVLVWNTQTLSTIDHFPFFYAQLSCIFPRYLTIYTRKIKRNPQHYHILKPNCGIVD